MSWLGSPDKWLWRWAWHHNGRLVMAGETVLAFDRAYMAQNELKLKLSQRHPEFRHQLWHREGGVTILERLTLEQRTPTAAE